MLINSFCFLLFVHGGELILAKDSILALSKEELVLLRNSEEGKDIETYGNLYEVAKNFLKLTRKDVNDGDFDGTAKFILDSAKEKLFTNIMTEWSATQIEEIADDSQDIHCELCGRKNILIYYIANKKNHTELHVGSSCIKKFPGIDNMYEVRKRFSDTGKTRNELKRMNAFNKLHPNTEVFLKNARRKYNDFPILLPWEIYKSLDNVINILQEIYKDFKVKGDIKNVDNIVSQFKIHESDYNTLWQKANKIKNSSNNEIIVCKRREYKWMIDNDKMDLLERISQNNGLYNSETIREVYNHEFIIDMQSNIRECCRDTVLTLREIKYENKKLIFTINDKIHRDYIEISISEKSFMDNLGWKCIFDEDYKIEINPEIFEIQKLAHNIGVILSRVNRNIAKTEENISYFYDDELGKLYLDKKIDETYKPINIDFFLNKYFKRMQLSEKNLREAYLKEYHSLDKAGNWKKIKDRNTEQGIKGLMAKN